MKNNKTEFTSGFTLLEMTVTMAMLAIVATSSMALVRTSYAAWSRHRQENEKRQSVTALVRHIERQVRQARAVQEITPTTDHSGSLSLLAADGDVLVWEHDSSSKEVRYGVGTATDVLATDIEELTFYGYKTSLALTTEVGLVHTIAVVAKTEITKPTGTSIESWFGSAHFRSW